MLRLGVDIGGTNARAALVDSENGRVVDSAKQALQDRTPDGVTQTVQALLGQLRQKPPEGQPVGVGLAGMIRGDVVVNAPNLGWRDVEIAARLETAVGRPVHLLNDLKAAAWGEFSAGASRGCSEVFTAFVGTGFGGAHITAGRLVEGASGVAGEIGHTKVVLEDGRPCGCGQRGCVEAYVSGANLVRWMDEAGIPGTASDLERLAGEGHPVAGPIYEQVVRALAQALANAVTLLNPQVLVLGGGVLFRCPGLVRRSSELALRLASVASSRAVAIKLAQLGDDAGLIGAALAR